MQMSKILKFYMNASKWIPTEQQWTHLSLCLNKHDSEYVHSFKFKKDCKIRLLSQLLIRYSIEILTNRDWADICIDRTSNGKPFYANKENKIDFNISHSSDYVAICAIKSVDANYQIGLDLMKIDDDDPKQYEQSKRIMRKVFTQKEREFVESKLSIKEKVEAFYRLWTLKESYLKAIGTGIRVELSSVEFIIHNNLISNNNDFNYNTELYVNSKKRIDCSFYEQVLDKYLASICLVNDKNDKISVDSSENIDLKTQVFTEISIDEILKVASKSFNMSKSDYWNLYLKKD
jgi:4'-phosphopantetheinyl transferase